jgi:hypothetical protein
MTRNLNLDFEQNGVWKKQQQRTREKEEHQVPLWNLLVATAKSDSPLPLSGCDTHIQGRERRSDFPVTRIILRKPIKRTPFFFRGVSTPFKISSTPTHQPTHTHTLSLSLSLSITYLLIHTHTMASSELGELVGFLESKERRLRAEAARLLCAVSGDPAVAASLRAPSPACRLLALLVFAPPSPQAALSALQALTNFCAAESAAECAEATAAAVQQSKAAGAATDAMDSSFFGQLERLRYARSLVQLLSNSTTDLGVVGGVCMLLANLSQREVSARMLIEPASTDAPPRLNTVCSLPLCSFLCGIPSSPPCLSSLPYNLSSPPCPSSSCFSPSGDECVLQRAKWFRCYGGIG